MQAAAKENHLEHALALFKKKQYAEAEALCQSLLPRSSEPGGVHYLLGLICHFTERSPQAINHLEQAVRSFPDDTHLLYNLGVVYESQKRHEEAIACYRKTLARQPDHADALNNMGLELIKTGQYAEGMACLEQALTYAPAHERAIANILQETSERLSMREQAAQCDKLLAIPTLSPENRYIALVHRAAAEWAIGNVDAIETTLSAVAAARPADPKQERMFNRFLYETFLGKLLAYRKNYPDMYRPANDSLFVIGDSHSLSWAGVTVPWEGVPRTIRSDLIVGAKAWHLSSATPNKYSVQFEAHLARLPRGVQLLCNFGEIDCRIDEGLIPFCQKTGGDPATVVAAEVKDYVAHTVARAAKQSVKPVFLALSAPHRVSGDRRQIIQLFNTELEKEAVAAGCRFIDLYALTVGADGYGDESCYLDDFHLKPEMLPRALGKN